MNGTVRIILPSKLCDFPEHIDMFLRGYLYDAFCEHNNTN